MVAQATAIPQTEHDALSRTLGVGALVLYGLGTIIGVGIYVLIGAIAGTAGVATPLAFLLAGALAGLTGLSYAELVGRHPAAEGSVAFIHQAFRSRLLSLIAGLAFATVGIVGAGSIALGGAGYVARFIPLPQPVIAAGVVALFTVIASRRVSESVRVAALFSAVEVGGLLLVVAVAMPSLKGIDDLLPQMLPTSVDALLGLGAGTFTAFFAYIGFEGMANMAEETRDVGRVLPRSILVAIIISALLYAAVSLVGILAVTPQVLAASPAPLVPVLELYAPALVGTFVIIAVAATLNGVLIEIVVVSRLAFGMARREHLWSWLGRLNKKTRTPVHATLAIGGVLLVLVLLVPFTTLVHVTSGLTLMLFLGVNASLWRLKHREPRPAGQTMVIPYWVPRAGVVACAALIVVNVWRLLSML